MHHCCQKKGIGTCSKVKGIIREAAPNGKKCLVWGIGSEQWLRVLQYSLQC